VLNAINGILEFAKKTECNNKIAFACKLGDITIRKAFYLKTFKYAPRENILRGWAANQSVRKKI